MTNRRLVDRISHSCDICVPFIFSHGRTGLELGDGACLMVGGARRREYVYFYVSGVVNNTTNNLVL